MRSQPSLTMFSDVAGTDDAIHPVVNDDADRVDSSRRGSNQSLSAYQEIPVGADVDYWPGGIDGLNVPAAAPHSFGNSVKWSRTEETAL